ncbi:MAG: nitronate monooxygenase family protein [Fibrobacterota bacterium]
MGIGISLSGLASAVANEGGIGVIATPGIGMSEPDYWTETPAANARVFRSEIQKAKKLTRGIIGVNIMVALTNYAELVKIAIDEKVDIVFSGAGLPMNLPEFVSKDSTSKLVPIVSSGRAAKIICKKWMDRYNYLPDAVVVEGPLAGGHLGFKAEHIFLPEYALEKLVPEVIEAVKPFEVKYGKRIPVIAGGGVYTGQDIRKFLALGVAGVQMATRFVTTNECDADIRFKQAYIDCTKEDITIIKSPVGMPGRAIRNSYITDVEQGKKKPFKCPYHCLLTCDVVNSPYCIALTLANAKTGNLVDGFAFAGANAYRAKKIISVKELIQTIADEYKASVNQS